MLTTVTIFERPKDFPDSFVARRFTSGPGAVFATSDYQISPTIEPLRRWAAKQCERYNQSIPVNMGRQLADEPHIIETWI